MKKLACVLALSSAFVSMDALAWGNDGHRAVGAIADKLLKGTNAEKQIAALLLPGESLESIANWADCVKGTYCGPQTPEMVEYVNGNPKHGTYHYTDVPFQLSHYHDHGVGTFEEDIVQTLKQAIAVLQGKTDPKLNPHKFTKRQALMILAHMTGDIHQPLHVGAAFVSKDGKFVVPKTHAEIDEVTIFDSRGGNNLLLDDQKLAELSGKLIPPGEPKPVREGVPQSLTKPFHSYWDSTTVDYAFRRLGIKSPRDFAQVAIDSQQSKGQFDASTNNDGSPVQPYQWVDEALLGSMARAAVDSLQAGGKSGIQANTGDPMNWPYQWANDALLVSKDAYKDVVPGKLVQQTSKKGEAYYTFTLEVPAQYPVPSSQIAKEQLIKGGYKLAEILKAVYG